VYFSNDTTAGPVREPVCLRGSPVIVLNEGDQLLLSIGLAGDDQGVGDEGLVEVHLVQLQLQGLGHLWDKNV